MTSTTNDNALEQTGFAAPVYQQPYQDDEIDLRELFKVIWDYKWLTVSLCTLAIICSVFYALNAQEWWVAKGKVIEPQLNDVASTYLKNRELSAITGNTQFNQFFDTQILLTKFTNAFNSSINKKTFLDNNDVFLAYLQDKKIKTSSNSTTSLTKMEKQAYREKLANWAKEIKASSDKKTSEIILFFQATTQESSAQLLNQYIDFISAKVKQEQVEKVSLLIRSLKNELQISLKIAEKNARNRLATQLQKTEYAYQIASRAELLAYQETAYKGDQLFAINIGAKALKEKLVVLKSIEDLSLFDPSIAQIRITLATLDKLEFADDPNFTPFRYLESVEEPLNRAKPKRALIVILATLLAGMLSIFIALTHHFLIKEK